MSERPDPMHFAIAECWRAYYHYGDVIKADPEGGEGKAVDVANDAFHEAWRTALKTKATTLLGINDLARAALDLGELMGTDDFIVETVIALSGRKVRDGNIFQRTE